MSENVNDSSNGRELAPTNPGSGRLEVPSTGWVDRIRTAILGGVGTVPVAGSALSALVDLIWKPTYEKRMDGFLATLVEELDKLSQRVEHLDELVQRDVVISVSLEAVAAAGRTHDELKHRFLANAVARVTVDPEWDARADFALILTRLVAELTTTHILILEFFADPVVWQELRGRVLKVEPNREGRFQFRALLAQAFGDLAIDDAIIRAVLVDLEGRGLLSAMGTGEEGASVSSHEQLMEPLVSQLGRSLLTFISSARD